MANDTQRDINKLDATDISLTSSNPFLKWIENFWYYHKWKVIIIAFFAIVLTVGIVQMVNKEDPDSEITLATHTIFYKENVDGIEQALVSLMPSDRNGDGTKKIQLQFYKIYSPEEMNAANEAETDEDGKPVLKAIGLYV